MNFKSSTKTLYSRTTMSFTMPIWKWIEGLYLIYISLACVPCSIHQLTPFRTVTLISLTLRRLSDRLNYTRMRIVAIRAQENEMKNRLRDVTYATISPRRPLKILKNRLRRQRKTDSSSYQIKTHPFRQEFNPQDIGTCVKSSMSISSLQ